jgi:DNA helicase-2/ATP-dependent DNA helicase PcrA
MTSSSDLNQAQRDAAEFGNSPLLIIAGAGTGKTNTLAHRVAHLIRSGADPRRILLLTFSRRAAQVMIRRAQQILSAVAPRRTAERRSGGEVTWAGTFHAVANRLLRMHAQSVGLDPSFTLLDRSDSADLLNVVRDELGLTRKEKRFPQKDTCLAIYSHVVSHPPNAIRRPPSAVRDQLQLTLERSFPAYKSWAKELKALFRGYVDVKQQRHVLDYDDLLLYWYHLVQDAAVAQAMRDRFDHILVDEYQDTNAIQAGILLGLKPDGHGLTVVGDDAQAIYAFRAATVRNILDFPSQFTPPAQVITLEQNYRSTQPILDAANAVIAEAPERFTKNLFSTKQSAQRPLLVALQDDQAQADFVVDRVLEQREAGTLLRRQAVLMRTSHHSAVLEIELARRNVPFVKFGGLKFLEAAHVKDVICVLRWAENPLDEMASFRILHLLPGIGPASARTIQKEFVAASCDFAALPGCTVPAAARSAWPAFCDLMLVLRRSREWHGQLEAVVTWYQPHLERLYDAAPIRAGDLAQLEQLSAGHESRERFLSDLTLDPPGATGDEAQNPLLDEDYLVLSTIHSAKGQEWDTVYVLNAVDGCIPSDMASGTAEEIEEERRLLYVAMTRARDFLFVLQPQRFYTGGRPLSDRHAYAPRTRFITDSIARLFERRSLAAIDVIGSAENARPPIVDIQARLKQMWT